MRLAENARSMPPSRRSRKCKGSRDRPRYSSGSPLWLPARPNSGTWRLNAQRPFSKATTACSPTRWGFGCHSTVTPNATSARADMASSGEDNVAFLSCLFADTAAFPAGVPLADRNRTAGRVVYGHVGHVDRHVRKHADYRQALRKPEKKGVCRLARFLDLCSSRRMVRLATHLPRSTSHVDHHAAE